MINVYQRIEATTHAVGLTEPAAARIYDPLWSLARQRQFGEIRGDDAGTPIQISVKGQLEKMPESELRIGPLQYSNTRTPLPSASHTSAPSNGRVALILGADLARRLRSVGEESKVAELASLFPLAIHPDLSDAQQGETVDVWTTSTPDGLALLRDPSIAGLEADVGIGEVVRAWKSFATSISQFDASIPGDWDPTTLSHNRTILFSNVSLSRPVDEAMATDTEEWYCVDVIETIDRDAITTPISILATPTRAEFPGQPTARLFEFEEGDVDTGLIETHPADMARIALLEYMFVYGNDHFVVPLQLPVGSVFQTDALVVSDVFGRATPVLHAQHYDPHWTLFTLHGDVASGGVPLRRFFLPPTSVGSIGSEVIEQVDLRTDELANIGWAIETRSQSPASGNVIELDGKLPIMRSTEQPSPDTAATWRFGARPPDNWFALVPMPNQSPGLPSRFLALSPIATNQSPATGSLLPRTGASQAGIAAQLNQFALPREGKRVRRRHVVLRWIPDAESSSIRVSRRIDSSVGAGPLSYDHAFDSLEVAE